MQHGVVLSEVRSRQGATHSVWDVLAALVYDLCPRGRLGVLGFAGGGVLAPLRALGDERLVETCDLERHGYDLFQAHSSGWGGNVRWAGMDASAWLRTRRASFDVLVDDLSIPVDQDVFKPDCSWSGLPGLVRSRLRPGGVCLANQLRPLNTSWRKAMKVFGEQFAMVQVVLMDDFENRIVIAGDTLPSVRYTGRQLRETLRLLRSRQADRVHLRQWSSR